MANRVETAELVPGTPGRAGVVGKHHQGDCI